MDDFSVIPDHKMSVWWLKLISSFPPVYPLYLVLPLDSLLLALMPCLFLLMGDSNMFILCINFLIITPELFPMTVMFFISLSIPGLSQLVNWLHTIMCFQWSQHGKAQTLSDDNDALRSISMASFIATWTFSFCCGLTSHHYAVSWVFWPWVKGQWVLFMV